MPVCGDACQAAGPGPAKPVVCHQTFIPLTSAIHRIPLSLRPNGWGSTVLELKNVTRRFGNRTAVDTVNFTLDRAGFIGIIGRSGAGKSTLLRMINRLTDASEGEILFKGRDVLALKGADMRGWQSQ